MPANKYSDSLLMDALRGSLSNAESFGRGFGVAPVGLLGDVNALAREYITPRLPANVQGLLQSMPSAPTTESILSAIPRMTAPRMESSGMEQIGAAANPRGPINLGRAVASLPSDVARAGQEFLAAGQPARVVAQVKPSFQYPQEQALKLAQERAALPVEQGGLGLLAENTPEMRAKAMGVQTDAYHGSKQDITGLFKAGYDDNLAFVTQSPEFASKWIGKGKLQSRIGAEDEIKAAEDLYRQIKYKHTDNELLSKLQGEEFNAAYDKMSVNARAEQQKEFGLRGNASGIYDTVYPVKVQANKTFNPETDMDVMSDFFKQNDIPPKLQELYAGGNYMMYETKPVVEYLKSKGYDSMRLRESTGDNYPTIAVFNPETVRSRFAAFDPFRKDVATATAMGVALPDLLAAEYNQQPQSAGLLYPLP